MPSNNVNQIEMSFVCWLMKAEELQINFLNRGRIDLSMNLSTGDRKINGYTCYEMLTEKGNN